MHPCQFEKRAPVLSTAGRKRMRVTYCPLPAVLRIVIDGDDRALCLEHWETWCCELGKVLRARFAAA